MLREKRDLVRRILRARSRAAPIFLGKRTRHSGSSGELFRKSNWPSRLESYRLARPAFTANGLATDKEIEEFLRSDAEVLKLRDPVPAAKDL